MRLAIWTASPMLALAGGAGPGPVDAQTRDVVVLTSFPKELFEAYKAAFEARTPGVRMVVKQQQTNAAVTYLRETRAKPEADIFWVSAVDAFQTLKADGLLDKVSPGKGIARPHSAPDRVLPPRRSRWLLPGLRRLRLRPDGEHTLSHATQAAGTAGVDGSRRSPLSWAPDHLGALAERDHPPDRRGDSPGVWLGQGPGAALPDGRQHGLHHRALVRGAGGGDLGSVRDRGGDRLLGLSAIASGHPVDVEFLLGDEGQLRLFSPEIGRLPVVPTLYDRVPRGYPNPFTMKLGGVAFDDKLSSSRRNVVNALFDQVITFRHAELRAAWSAIHAAEAQIARARAAGKNSEAAAGQLADARRLARAVPLDGKRAAEKDTNEAFKGKAEVKSQMETEWDTFARSNYLRARELADAAAVRAR
jgi:phosphoglycerate transport regulatory protein PgtC